MGVRVHNKAGKLIPPTQEIDWLGWSISSVRMVVQLTPEKSAKGYELCINLLRAAENGVLVTAKDILRCSGFLTFVTYVVKQGQPYVRTLWRCVGSAKVFAAWSSGHRRFNPAIRLSPQAVQDLRWWANVFQCQPQRPIQWAGGRAFLWHQRQPDFDALQQLAWNDGLMVVVYTDASGDFGWGVACGDTWRQGRWDNKDLHKSINWKELRAYHIALQELSTVLTGKLLVIKMDNTCAVHYVNAGQGRIEELSQLAKQIRLDEIRMGVESVALHLPGYQNVTADALSRLYTNATSRDAHPHRAFKKRLFNNIQQSVGTFTLDAMADEFGSNAQCENFCHPSNSFFEADISEGRTWIFPPRDMIHSVLAYLRERRKRHGMEAFAILLPELPNASWFWMLDQYHRLARYNVGSDLFRESVWENNEVVFKKLQAVREPWLVLTSLSQDAMRNLSPKCNRCCHSLRPAMHVLWVHYLLAVGVSIWWDT